MTAGVAVVCAGDGKAGSTVPVFSGLFAPCPRNEKAAIKIAPNKTTASMIGIQSTIGGDLRIPHFLGLHALQALPLAGYLLSKPKGHDLARGALFAALAGLYSLAMVHTFLQALGGEPLIGS